MAPKILIIDDNAGDLRLMEEYLRLGGFENVLQAQNGKDGLGLAEREQPAIVIVDTNLPVMDGMEITRKLKAIKAFTPWVIVITGGIDAVDPVKVQDCGADDYCMKTLEFEQMIAAVKKAVTKIEHAS